jgi:hypothetical protein
MSEAQLATLTMKNAPADLTDEERKALAYYINLAKVQANLERINKPSDEVTRRRAAGLVLASGGDRDTYNHRDRVKALGGIFDGSSWLMPTEDALIYAEWLVSRTTSKKGWQGPIPKKPVAA